MTNEFSIKIEHDYNAVLIYLTDNLHMGSTELISKLRYQQPTDGNVLTEVQLTQFKGVELSSHDNVKLFDLIRMYCNEFYASSVYIFGEDIHLNGIQKLFKTNPTHIDKNCLVKFIKSNPEENLEDVAIVLHGEYKIKSKK